MDNTIQKTLLERLRESTYPIHKKLDHVFFQDINHVSKHEYIRFLEVHYVFYSQLHAKIEEGNDDFKAYLLQLIGLIKNDLLEINCKTLQAESENRIKSLHATGVKYVIYGSSNGAAMINAKLAKQDWAKALKRRFLSRRESHWKPFLNEIKNSNSDNNEIVKSAVEAFEIIHKISTRKSNSI